MKSKSKKTTKRSKVKYPGLQKNVNSKVKQEYMDQDYIDHLSDDEKKWLSDFNEEFYGGNFKHSGKKFHRVNRTKRDCYNRNNARNRCLYGLKRAGGLITDQANLLQEIEEIQKIDKDSVEDAIIKLIDITSSDEE